MLLFCLYARNLWYDLETTSHMFFRICTILIHNVIIRIWRLILKSCANINLLRSIKKPSSPYFQLLIFFCFLNLFCAKHFFPIIIMMYTLIFCCYLSNDYNIDCFSIPMISNTMIKYIVNEITSMEVCHMNHCFSARIKFTELAMNKVQQIYFID